MKKMVIFHSSVSLPEGTMHCGVDQWMTLDFTEKLGIQLDMTSSWYSGTETLWV